jgi:hypothetical protein
MAESDKEAFGKRMQDLVIFGVKKGKLTQKDKDEQANLEAKARKFSRDLA